VQMSGHNPGLNTDGRKQTRGQVCEGSQLVI